MISSPISMRCQPRPVSLEHGLEQRHSNSTLTATVTSPTCAHVPAASGCCCCCPSPCPVSARVRLRVPSRPEMPMPRLPPLCRYLLVVQDIWDRYDISLEHPIHANPCQWDDVNQQQWLNQSSTWHMEHGHADINIQQQDIINSTITCDIASPSQPQSWGLCRCVASLLVTIPSLVGRTQCTLW